MFPVPVETRPSLTVLARHSTTHARDLHPVAGQQIAPAATKTKLVLAHLLTPGLQRKRCQLYEVG